MTYDEVTYPFLAPACRRDQCNHTVHPRYRTTRCRSGQCGCASKNLACGTTGVDRPALEGTGPVLPFPIGPVTPKSDQSDRDTEEQPPTANATMSPRTLNQALKIAGTVASVEIAKRLIAPGGEGARVVREMQRQVDDQMRRYRDEHPGTQA